ncbi:MAG: HD domain-containing protein [Thermoleophilia bacterium]
MLQPTQQLAARALAFAVRAHAGRRRASDGAPFIQHPLEVARLLRDAGCHERVVAAGLLRDHIRFVGGEVALLFAADKISKVREWPMRVRRDEARLLELRCDSRTRRYLERHHEMRLEHYRASLAMLDRVIPGHPLVEQLADALESCSAQDGSRV